MPRSARACLISESFMAGPLLQAGQRFRDRPHGLFQLSPAYDQGRSQTQHVPVLPLGQKDKPTLEKTFDGHRCDVAGRPAGRVTQLDADEEALPANLELQRWMMKLFSQPLEQPIPQTPAAFDEATPADLPDLSQGHGTADRVPEIRTGMNGFTEGDRPGGIHQ